MNTNIVQQEFDQKAKEYESNRLADWYKAHADEILKHCPESIDGDILDIGCATGYQLRLLADKYPNSNLVGIDLAAKMIAQADSQYSDTDRSNFIADNWEQLSEHNHQLLQKFNFKLIICANTFHYFLDPEKAVSSMYQLLDTDGMLLILEREKSDSLLTSFWGFLHRHFIKDQVEFYSAADITHILDNVGFSNSQVVSIIRKYFWKGKLFTSIALIKGKKSNG